MFLNTKLRQAKINDKDYIRNIAWQYKAEIGFVNPSSIQDAINRNNLVVAELNGKIIGYQLYRHLKRKPQTTLYNKVVLPDFRRQGIATTLVDYVVSEAIEKGNKFVIVKCVKGLDSNAFHINYGFKLLTVEKGKLRQVNVYKLKLVDKIGK